MTVSVQYVKRFQMVFDFGRQALAAPVLPPEYRWIPWSPSLLETHAKVKYLSFCDDLDARIFPSFASLDRCRNLMNAISSRNGFLPETTWLIARTSSDSDAPPEYCATIQGIRHAFDSGGIQNVAVMPDFRRRGLGQSLVLKALDGFRNAGVRKVALEVTAENATAVRLYNRIGFETVQTVYKETRGYS